MKAARKVTLSGNKRRRRGIHTSHEPAGFKRVRKKRSLSASIGARPSRALSRVRVTHPFPGRSSRLRSTKLFKDEESQKGTLAKKRAKPVAKGENIDANKGR
jgi:hypothetical protein